MRTGHCESASHPTYPAVPRRLCASGRRDHCRTARASGMAVGEATRRCRGTVCGRVIRQQMGRWRDDGRFDPRERHRLPGIHTRGDRIEEDEIGIVNNVPTTTPARTVLDLGCWYPTTSAVAAIDSLARAVEVKAADVELLAQRYPGRRGITRARRALALFDAGAQSPKETWLRLLLVKPAYQGRRHRFRCAMNSAVRSPISRWAGRTSRSRSNTTVSSTAMTDGNTPGMSGG